MLWRKDAHVLRKPLEFEVDGQRKEGRPKAIGKKQFEEDILRIVLSKEDEVFRSQLIAATMLR